MPVTKRTTVLVIDADPVGLTATAAVLYSSDYECICARGFEAARKAVQQDQVDLVVMDISKSWEESMELVRELRERVGGDALPAILLCDGVHDASVDTANLGPTTYRLVKPFDPNALIELVRNSVWMPHLVTQHRKRGERPATKGWVSL
jgi:DNA-binding NtrC family response regulator